MALFCTGRRVFFVGLLVGVVIVVLVLLLLLLPLLSSRGLVRLLVVD